MEKFWWKQSSTMNQWSELEELNQTGWLHRVGFINPKLFISNRYIISPVKVHWDMTLLNFSQRLVITVYSSIMKENTNLWGRSILYQLKILLMWTWCPAAEVVSRSCSLNFERCMRDETIVKMLKRRIFTKL